MGLSSLGRGRSVDALARAENLGEAPAMIATPVYTDIDMYRWRYACVCICVCIFVYVQIGCVDTCLRLQAPSERKCVFL